MGGASGGIGVKAEAEEGKAEEEEGKAEAEEEAVAAGVVSGRAGGGRGGAGVLAPKVASNSRLLAAKRMAEALIERGGRSRGTSATVSRNADGPCREMHGYTGRCREMHGDTGRCREIACMRTAG